MQQLSKYEFETMTQEAEVLEEDGFGKKVLRLPNTRILKLFRRKRWISSQLWAPHAKRFQNNAKKLADKGILTIDVITTFSIPEIDRQAVLYHEIPGTTLRTWLKEHGGYGTEHLIQEFGRFVAKLHAKGVLFRSLHFGNVLVTPDQQLALIDIVDMRLLKRAVSTRERIRNFSHIARYTEDSVLFTKNSEHTFIEAYLKAIQLKPNKQTQLRKAFISGLYR